MVRVLRLVGVALLQAPHLLPHVLGVGVPGHRVDPGHRVPRLLGGLRGGGSLPVLFLVIRGVDLGHAAVGDALLRDVGQGGALFHLLLLRGGDGGQRVGSLACRTPALLVDAREQSVDGNLQQVFYHAGQEDLKELAGLLYARVCVDLDEPHIEILIEYEIVAEELERVLAPVRVQLLPHRIHGFHDQVLNLRDYIIVHRDAAVRVRVIDDLLETPVPELVAIFEGAVIL